MATSAAAIEAAIIAQLEANCDVDLGSEQSQLQCFINAIAEGVYAGMQALSDTAGTPPSPTHV